MVRRDTFGPSRIVDVRREKHVRSHLTSVEAMQRNRRGEPPRQGCAGVGLDLPVGDVAQAVALSFDQSPAGGAEARIEAEDPQESLYSSSSGTS